MDPIREQAKAGLEAAGLTVRPSGENALWVAATVTDAGDGLRLSHDACMLIRDGERWVAVFPAAGHRTYEVPGEPADLVALIRGVYGEYRRSGGPFWQALPRVVPGVEAYLAGGPAAGRASAAPLPSAASAGELWGPAPKKS